MVREFLVVIIVWALAVGSVALGSEAVAAARVCGDIPGEAAAVATVRFTAEQQCPCPAATDHRSYVACVREVVENAISSGALPSYCKRTAMRGARRSTCGKPGDTVTCCKVTATGREVCQVKRSLDKCVPPRGGTAAQGATESCYDACLPPLSQRTFTDAELEAALDIAGEGISDGWETEFPLVMLRFLGELQARGESVSADPQAYSAQYASAPECRQECYGDTDCLDAGVKYCGWANSRNVPLLRLEAPSPELNRACFEHDMCYFETCVTFKTGPLSPDCTFSQQTDACDAQLFAVCDELAPCDCGPNPLPAPPSVNNWDRFICGWARKLQGARHAQALPACSQVNRCVQSNAVCIPETGECCGDGDISQKPWSCEECDPPGDGCDSSCRLVTACQSDLDCNPGATGLVTDPDADCIWARCRPGAAGADGNGCVADEIEGNGSPCDDGWACTSPDQCSFGVCGGGPNRLLCSANRGFPASNDPDADCIYYLCYPPGLPGLPPDSDGCIADFESSFSPCDDGNACTDSRGCAVGEMGGSGDKCFGLPTGGSVCCGTPIPACE